MDNLRRHGTIGEPVLEDSLATWDPSKNKASETLDVLAVLKKKRDEHGNVTELKARIVVDGSQEKKKMPWLDGFTPTTPPSTLRTLVADACLHEKKIYKADVPGAYLKGVLEKDDPVIYVRPLKNERSFLKGIPLVYKAGTSWYGEVKAGAIWNRTFINESTSSERGFKQSEYDPCHLYKVYKNGSLTDICLYVDDLFCTLSADCEDAQRDFDDLMQHYECKVEQNPTYFLGINIDIESKSKISLTSSTYLKKAADELLPKPLSEYRQSEVPSTEKLFAAYEDALYGDRCPSPELLRQYQCLVGKCIYPTPYTRPDCCWAIGICARAMTFPTPELLAEMEHCLAYMAHTCAVGVTFDGKAKDADVLCAYCDSDWAVSNSTSGHYVKFCNGPLTYSSKRQHCIAMSSTEAEIISASQAATELVYLRGCLEEMGYIFDEPPVLYCDNTGAIALSKHRTSCKYSKHVTRRDLKCREYVAAELISVAYVPTAENGADIFTKHLNKVTFNQLASTVLGQSCDVYCQLKKAATNVTPVSHMHTDAASSFPPSTSNAEAERRFKS